MQICEAKNIKDMYPDVKIYRSPLLPPETIGDDELIDLNEFNPDDFEVDTI